MPDSALQFRPLHAADQSKLWNWLHIALWDPPPAPPRPRSVLEDRRVRIYAEHWGLPTDVGVIAVVDGHDAGACWMRLVQGGLGMAYVDDETPQLGIALEPPYQHRGFGKRLMREALLAAWRHGYAQVSLTVHPENPAIAVYRACGFEARDLRRTYHLMVAERPAAPTVATRP